MIKGIVFDMDGLIIDSERVTYEEYVKSIDKLGLEKFDEETYKQLLGKTKDSILQVFYDKYGNDFPMQQVWDECHEGLDNRLLSEKPIKEGCLELLEYLKANNYKAIVATSSQRHRVDKILEACDLTKYFDDVICGDEVTHGKPHPEIFLEGCKKIGIDPSEALVLEDSEAGILAAFNGNMKVICVPDMKYPTEDYANKTTKIVDSLKDVITYLEDQK